MGEDQKHSEQTSGKAPADGPGRKTFPAAYQVPCNGKQKEAAHKAVPVIEHSVFGEAMPDGIQKTVMEGEYHHQQHTRSYRLPSAANVRAQEKQHDENHRNDSHKDNRQSVIELLTVGRSGEQLGKQTVKGEIDVHFQLAFPPNG